MGKFKSFVKKIFSFEDTPPTVIQNFDPGDGETFDIVYHPHGGYIDRMCRRLGGKISDSGESTNTMEINGCFDHNKQIMYLSNNTEKLFKHELNHRNNPTVWDGKKWVPVPRKKKKGK